MLRRLHPEQPDSFEFTPANLDYARAWVSKYPEGRAQSAIIPVLWRAQEQEGWLTRPAIEYCAELLGMPYIRALEVATFYFMFQLQPVGSVAHIQICGTTTCMICGAEELMRICREKIAPQPHMLSEDGKFSWEEVECLGACANAPMAQIGKDYYEDLTAQKLSDLIDAMGTGAVPRPGPQNGRYASEAAGGATALVDQQPPADAHNASVARAVALGETLKRIDGTEVETPTPWLGKNGALPELSGLTATDARPAPQPAHAQAAAREAAKAEKPKPAQAAPADKPATPAPAAAEAAAPSPGRRPEGLSAARDGGPDDLKRIKGVGPKLEKLLHRLGFYHFDQVAKWGADEVAWVDENLEGFKGRVSRDEWVRQAKALAEGRDPEDAN